MKRRNPVKVLEASELVLARLRADRTRLDAEIASLEERHEADVQQFVLEAVKRLNLTQVPAASLLAGLEQLAQGARVDRPMFEPGNTSANAGTSDAPRQDLAAAFVRLTRNTSADNREILAREGMRWNGRSAGWSGRVSREALQRLRDAFPGRVEGPEPECSDAAPNEEAGPGILTERPPITSPDAPQANVEADAVAPAEDRAAGETAAEETAIRSTQPAVSAASRLLRPAYRSPVLRRP